MTAICHHLHGKDIPAIFLTNVFHQLFASLFHLVYQHFSAIRRAENKVIVIRDTVVFVLLYQYFIYTETTKNKKMLL